MKAIAQSEKSFFHLVGFNPLTLERSDLLFYGHQHGVSFQHGASDQSGLFEGVALRAVSGTDEVERGAFNVVAAMAGDTVWTPSAESSSVGTVHIVPSDPNVAASA